MNIANTIILGLLFGSVASLAFDYDPTYEYAAYNPKNSYGTIIVARKAGTVSFYSCYDQLSPEDASHGDAIIAYAQNSCSTPETSADGSLKSTVSTSYISGGTNAVVTVSQVYEFPDNFSEPGELGSNTSTYLVKTWPTAPVANGDTIIYTGTSIVHDHSATPQISTVRITYELIGVKRVTEE